MKFSKSISTKKLLKGFRRVKCAFIGHSWRPWLQSWSGGWVRTCKRKGCDAAQRSEKRP